MTHRRNQHPRAFTLLELLLVVVIIGILAAAIVPNLVGRAQQARIVTARSDITALGVGLDLYEQAVGGYPTTQQGLAALIAAPAGVNNWTGPYLKSGSVPTDPWNNPYDYAFPSARSAMPYDLVCRGPDGKLGSEDDITGEPPKKK